jgi:excisionase family DNA binding protein
MPQRGRSDEPALLGLRATASASPAATTTAHPSERSSHMARPEDRLTIAQLCQELGISRSTFYEWRAKGRAPRCIKLPNGQIRIRRAEFERWLESLEEVA